MCIRVKFNDITGFESQQSYIISVRTYTFLEIIAGDVFISGDEETLLRNNHGLSWYYTMPSKPRGDIYIVNKEPARQPSNSTMTNKNRDYIMLTTVYFISSYTSLLYSKAWVYRGIQFSYFVQDIDCGYLLEPPH